VRKNQADYKMIVSESHFVCKSKPIKVV